VKARTIPAWQVLLLGPLGAMLFLTLGSLVLGFATMYFPGPDSINVVTIAYVVGIAHVNAMLTTPLYIAFVLLLVGTMLWGTGRWVTPTLIIATVGAALSLVVHYMTAAPNTSLRVLDVIATAATALSIVGAEMYFRSHPRIAKDKALVTDATQ
jgi:hypothetical protein